MDELITVDAEEKSELTEVLIVEGLSTRLLVVVTMLLMEEAVVV